LGERLAMGHGMRFRYSDGECDGAHPLARGEGDRMALVRGLYPHVEVYSVANAPHDYSGNEVDVLDLERAQPVWTDSCADAGRSAHELFGLLPDGRPTSRHTYYGVRSTSSTIASCCWRLPGRAAAADGSRNEFL